MKHPLPPGTVLITRDLRYMIIEAAEHLGRNGKGGGGFAGYLERLSARKISSAKLQRLQGASAIALTVEPLSAVAAPPVTPARRQRRPRTTR